MKKRFIMAAVLVGTLVTALGHFPMAHAQQSQPLPDKKEAVVIQLT